MFFGYAINTQTKTRLAVVIAASSFIQEALADTVTNSTETVSNESSGTSIATMACLSMVIAVSLLGIGVTCYYSCREKPSDAQNKQEQQDASDVEKQPYRLLN